jgi:hypothetical protein
LSTFRVLIWTFDCSLIVLWSYKVFISFLLAYAEFIVMVYTFNSVFPSFHCTVYGLLLLSISALGLFHLIIFAGIVTCV